MLNVVSTVATSVGSFSLTGDYNEVAWGALSCVVYTATTYIIREREEKKEAVRDAFLAVTGSLEGRVD